MFNSISITLTYFLLHIILILNIYLTYTLLEAIFKHFGNIFSYSKIMTSLQYVFYLSLCLSFFYIPSYTLSLSPIVALLSNFFAIAAANIVFLLIKRLEKGNLRFFKSLLSVSIILTSLSLFSKEDYALFLVLLNGILIYYLRRRKYRKYFILYFICIVLSFLLFTLYTFIISSNPHVVSQEQGYGKTVDPKIILLRTFSYLTTFGISNILSLSFLVISILLVIYHLKNFKMILVIYSILVSTVIPYSILIEKFHETYVLNWWFFLCAFVAIGTDCILRTATKWGVVRFFISLKLLLAVFIFYSNVNRSLPDFNFYLEKISSIQNISAGLKLNTPIICSNQIIGISLPSPDIYNPWAQDSKNWLKKTVGCDADWLIFTSEESYTYQTKTRGLSTNDNLLFLRNQEFNQDKTYVFSRKEQFILNELEIPILVYNMDNEFVMTRLNFMK